MRLNPIIEEDYGKGECNFRAAPGTGPTPAASFTGASYDGVHDPAVLRINHAHEEQMGMGDHPSC
jgi:hypothetical protein